MSRTFGSEDWGVILGGSSGFGLATAHKLAAHGMNLALVHRDRRGAMHRIEPEFEKLRGTGVQLRTWNADALDPAKRAELVVRAEGPARLGARADAAPLDRVREPEAARARAGAAEHRRRGAGRRARRRRREARGRGRQAARGGPRRAGRDRDGARVPDPRLPRYRRLRAHHPLHGHEPARLGAGSAPRAGCSRATRACSA